MVDAHDLGSCLNRGGGSSPSPGTTHKTIGVICMYYSSCEYIWMDGANPSQKLRSKTRILKLPNFDKITLDIFPDWGFDGSSTYQAQGKKSDLVLKPVQFIKDSYRGDNNYIILCEVFNPDGSPHSTNTRAKLRSVLNAGADKEEAWFGVEQEYTLFKNRIPMGWPEKGYPAPQGPFYCGIGADEVFGRELVEKHLQCCISAGVMIFGVNAEVMPGQWEFQIGYRNIQNESADPLTTSDHVWFARYFLYRLGEDFKITATLDNKPIKGNWNGAGQHTNFSTKSMRDHKTGRSTINNIIKLLEKKHSEHIKVYGYGLSERLTGLHETSDIESFSSGVSNREASIRIPLQVSINGYGYLEDRRPGANADPYQVSARILQTICNID